MFVYRFCFIYLMHAIHVNWQLNCFCSCFLYSDYKYIGAWGGYILANKTRINLFMHERTCTNSCVYHKY